MRGIGHIGQADIADMIGAIAVTCPLRKIELSVLAAVLVAFLAGGCSNDIWNAGDLAEWVRDRAVEQGCERESIELDDWYTTEAGKNNWHGSCTNRDGAERMRFAINVDSVWTPSSGG